MGIFEWFKKLVGQPETTGLDKSAQNEDQGPTSRIDKRLLPKDVPKYSWRARKPVMSRHEANRLFSTSLRSQDLDKRRLLTDRQKLKELGLPIWEDETLLAKWLALSTSQLWYFSNHRYDDKICHYIRFAIPKARGGYREIMAPKRKLKVIQRKLLRELAELPVHEAAHGFVTGRSVKTHAQNHVDRAVVIKIDLTDFFGSVTFGRVRGLLLAYGFSYPVATSLALLMTEAKRQPVMVDGTLRYVPIGHRYCVQGAPTSPLLCNAISKRMDARLTGLAKSVGFTYSRYADDMAFSGDDTTQIGQLLANIRRIIKDEGFRVNEAKTRVMRSGQQQRVTGVTVNKELGLSRKERRALRAQIHRYNANPDPREYGKIQGKIAYLNMLNPTQAQVLKAQVKVAHTMETL